MSRLVLRSVSGFEIFSIDVPAPTIEPCESIGKEVGIGVLSETRDRCGKLQSNDLLVVCCAWDSKRVPSESLIERSMSFYPH